MEERKALPTEPIRNPPPTPERILTVLYTIWAEEHGVVLSDIKITKATAEEKELKKQKFEQLCRRKRKCSRSSK